MNYADKIFDMLGIKPEKQELSELEKKIVEFAKESGATYLTRMENGIIVGWSDKPRRLGNARDIYCSKNGRVMFSLEVASADIDFIKYDDEEPYYIGR